MPKAIVVIAIALVLLTACSSAAGPGLAATPLPTPTPPEPAVREALGRLSNPGGISEVVPGFGGIFLDPQGQ